MTLWIIRHSNSSKIIQTPSKDFTTVLVGSDYWSGLLSWINGTLLEQEKVARADLGLLRIADDPDEVVQIIKDAHSQVDAVTHYSARPDLT